MINDYRTMFDLHGKVVFVAGGAGAIGAELARAAAHFGASIAIADISEERCSRIAQEIGKGGGATMGVALNVREPETVDAAVAAVEAKLGAIDVLINSVGTHIEQPAEELTMEAWDTVLDINLRGAFVLSQAVAKAMIAAKHGGSPELTRGSHIHITSVRSALGIRRGYAAYVSSKGGLGLLIKQLASEWAHYGIRVNGIAPTFTRTPLVDDYLNDPEFLTALVARIPLGRVCETSDLAGLAVFLASDASSFITGQNIFVDGGVTATQ
jgi:NAD(P)-dependent dehydrogenase (short-subunit alcohol dehydrogenase family)